MIHFEQNIIGFNIFISFCSEKSVKINFHQLFCMILNAVEHKQLIYI